MARLAGLNQAVLWKYVHANRIIPDRHIRLGKRSRVLFEVARVQEILKFAVQARLRRYDGIRLPPDVRIERIRACARQYAATRWLKLPQHRLIHRLRSRIWKALTRNKGARVPVKTIFLVGCTIPELRTHIASLFKPGMSWENYGIGGWVIDHVLPCSKFDLSEEAEQQKCFHFTNLQPLWDIQNRKKGARTDFAG